MNKKHVHIMGAGGSGASAVLALAAAAGFKVSGCDRQPDSPYLGRKLAKLVAVGHEPAHLTGVDIVAYSPAVPTFDPDNPELQAAIFRKIRAFPWEQFVAEHLLRDKFVVAIAGTHGKGTVTAMVAAILEKAGLDPTCLVGAVVTDWGKNYRVGRSRYFVIEVDEFSERFLKFQPDIAAITNIEFDHPEYFENFAQVQAAFEKFTLNLKKNSSLIVGPGVILNNPNGRRREVTYIPDINLKMIGKFNKLNAAIAAAVAVEVGIDRKTIIAALEGFAGLARRLEFKGEEKGVLVFDDYAHHPTAIAATLDAVRGRFREARIWVVFQPHLFTRTKVLFNDFATVFAKAPVDAIIITDIFAAREKDTGEVSSKKLASEIRNNEAKYLGSLEEAATYLAKYVTVRDVVISMGAGDIYKFPTLLLAKLKNKA